MTLKDTAQEALSYIQKEGIEKGQATLTRSEIHELELQGDSINLCRTYFKDEFSFKAVNGQRKASSKLNRWDDTSRAQLLQDLKAGLEASPEDPAYDILDSNEQKTFTKAVSSPNLEGLLKSMQDFLGWAKKAYPKVHFESSPIQFIKAKQVLANTSGLSLEATEDYYSGFLMFTGKDDKSTTSFNYVDFSTQDVPEQLQSMVGIDDILRLTTRELESPMDAKDATDVVLTPYVLPSFLGYFLQHISTGSLMSGTSVFKDKVNSKILSDKFSLYSQPTSDKFATFEPYTGDGILAEEGTIFEKGVLKNYLLDLYGSHKLKMNPTPFSGSYLSLENGDSELAQMISGIKRGILLARFSGGLPSANGDFSGVAKNSFLIENGEIAGPLRETMISGNMIRLFSQIESISKESINFGSRELPWVHAKL